ncbi:NAD-dependent epimerase/dehydratase family protein [Gordonia polyisoprenivorans]|uniref:NAD-dependent epimerase/dehydratase family protein n=1 Tax=Gordonia polyisoprenivorans TaxID=84595 RepID=UPI0003A9D379|nr:NAD-dependent epimerase/dehydratase family protein [Gordonia polyisoprenivorans]UZF54508.1 NAD-dependent epimerase/dehydratase family protein [Gordonia polyisoprenivorans]
MRALVMGARGAVGRVVVEELRSRGHVVTRAGRDAGKDLIGLDLTRLDLTAPEGLRTLAHLSAVHDVVINASGVETPALARCGAPAVVEISATSAYLAALRRALCEDVGGTTMSEASVGTVVTGAGLVPGLSTLLIAELDTEPGDDVDLGVVLGTGDTTVRRLSSGPPGCSVPRFITRPRDAGSSIFGSPVGSRSPAVGAGATCGPISPTMSCSRTGESECVVTSH